MAILSCPVDSACPTPYAITAAQTTVPMMALSLPETRRSGCAPSLSPATEGLQKRVSLGVREVGADQLAVPSVEPFTEAVEVGVLSDQEQGRPPGPELGPDPLQVLLADAGPFGGLDEGADPSTEHCARHGDG